MTVPQSFQYQDSKRTLAPLILQYLPVSTTRLVEPFGGSAAGSRSAADPGGGFGHRPGARFWNWRRDAPATGRRGRLRYGGSLRLAGMPVPTIWKVEFKRGHLRRRCFALT